MRLTSLTLAGFKSFGDRTTLEFDAGVTAVVGPNGAGKSNLLDALKWATGGGRARQYRAEDKTDLIFHGAAGKRSLGYAEVEVELRDGERRLVIRRDLDREGGSTLRLNGKTARFVDVDEALAGSGLGTAGVAVISQGEVAGVLMADPEKLLQYVAEAAGVARLALRREQTVARLATAREHLQTLETILADQRQEVVRLQAEAADAERFDALAREALVLRATAAHARLRALQAEVRELRSREGGHEQAVLESEEAIADGRSGVGEARSCLQAAETRYREAAAEFEQKRGLAALARAEAQRSSERLEVVEQRCGALRAEIERLAAVNAPNPPQGDADTLAATAEAAGRQAERRRDEAAAAAAAAVEAARASAARRDELERAERAWSAHASRLASLREELEAAREQVAALASSDAPDPAPARERAAAAAAALRRAEAALEASREGLGRLQAEHGAAQGEAAARSRALERQRAAHRARQGYAQGPKHALTSGIPGVLGSVADLLRVPPGYQAAVAGALGRRAEYVVVDTAETAASVLEHVRRAGGWVTLLPLDLLRGTRAPSWPGEGEDGVVGPAVELVEVDPPYRGVAEQLLAGTVVVESLTVATALARRHHRRPRLVSMRGDTLDGSGAMSGGRRHDGLSVLGAARDLEDAEAEAERAGAEAQRLLGLLEAERTRLGTLRVAADAARQEAQRWAAEAARAEAAASAQLRLREEASARVARLQRAAAEAEAPPDAAEPHGLRGAEDEARRAAGEAERLRRETDERWREAERLAASAREAHAVHRERRRAFELEWERFDAAQARLAQARGEEAHEERALAAARRERERAHDAACSAEAAVPGDLADVRTAFERARSELSRIEATLDARAQAQRGLLRALEELRLTLARREAALELAQEEAQALPPGVTPLELAERTARQRLREVEAAQAAIGPVNHRAARDHAERSERLQALERDVGEAYAAANGLEGTLERLDRETTAGLTEAIGALRRSFRRHVRDLFGEDASARSTSTPRARADRAAHPADARPASRRRRSACSRWGSARWARWPSCSR
jgi:chromosome segregation protein